MPPHDQTPEVRPDRTTGRFRKPSDPEGAPTSLKARHCLDEPCRDQTPPHLTQVDNAELEALTHTRRLEEPLSVQIRQHDRHQEREALRYRDCGIGMRWWLVAGAGGQHARHQEGGALRHTWYKWYGALRCTHLGSPHGGVLPPTQPLTRHRLGHRHTPSRVGGGRQQHEKRLGQPLRIPVGEPQAVDEFGP
jgi:hypothetical protein